MSNTTHADRSARVALNLVLGFSAASVQAVAASQDSQAMTQTQARSETLSIKQQAIVPIAAFGAAGDMACLNLALN